MLIQVVGTRRYLVFEQLARHRGLVHAFSTRPYDMALHDREGHEQRTTNRQVFAADLRVDAAAVCFAGQVHQTRLATISDPDQAGVIPETDGLLTRLPQKPLMTFSADCPLVLLYDPQQDALGMAHASWRCTVAQITRQLVERMTADFNSRPADLQAGIGPGISAKAYEVGEDVRAAAQSLHEPDRFFAERDERLYFDLAAANTAQLVEAGVPAAQVEPAGLCTVADNDLFFSHRKEQTPRRFGLLAALLPR